MACASVTSEPKPQSGQKNRSSGNFSTEGCPGTRLRWSCPTGISFNVMKDVPMGRDPVIFYGIANGTITKMYKARSLYIANPRWADSSFTVSVEGI
ncbi:MAG: DeoR family transcriptional regulator [Acidobacteria bacterium]|nr:DeoR family transcriptional regulator [Acidobacteriota bacterium]